MSFVANSTPMVVFDSMLNSSFVNRFIKLDFPTPESPIYQINDEFLSTYQSEQS